MKRGIVVLGILGLVTLLMPAMEALAAYPERPVECIVPWGVGGGSTLFARALTQPTEKFLGQPIPIINIPGASGGLGLIEYMKRPADGYSIITVNTDTVIGSALGTYKHTVDELDFIIRAAVSDTWAYVRKDSPFKTFQEVVEYAKKNPDKLKFGGEGIASNEVLMHAGLAKAGVKMKYINYEGGSEMHAALLRGEVDLASGEISQTASFMESGQMRPLVLAMNQRHPGWPNVPITKELGFNIVLPMLRGIAIKKGADPAIRKVLEDAFMKGAASDAYKNFMISKKLDPKAGLLNSQDFTKFIQENYLFVKTLIKETGYLVK